MKREENGGKRQRYHIVLFARNEGNLGKWGRSRSVSAYPLGRDPTWKAELGKEVLPERVTLLKIYSSAKMVIFLKFRGCSKEVSALMFDNWGKVQMRDKAKVRGVAWRGLARFGLALAESVAASRLLLAYIFLSSIVPSRILSFPCSNTSTHTTDQLCISQILFSRLNNLLTGHTLLL